MPSRVVSTVQEMRGPIVLVALHVVLHALVQVGAAQVRVDRIHLVLQRRQFRQNVCPIDVDFLVPDCDRGVGIVSELEVACSSGPCDNMVTVGAEVSVASTASVAAVVDDELVPYRCSGRFTTTIFCAPLSMFTVLDGADPTVVTPPAY